MEDFFLDLHALRNSSMNNIFPLNLRGAADLIYNCKAVFRSPAQKVLEKNLGNLEY